MGASNSKQPAGRSPSAAFGRLRISSPRVGKVVQRNIKEQQRIRSLVNLQAAGGGSNARGLLPPTEGSPLLFANRHLNEQSSVMSSSDDGMVASPPMMVWIGPALVCALCYALYNIFIKKGSASIHPVLGGVILQLVAAALGSCLLAALVWRDTADGQGGFDALPYDQEGIQWAVLAGIAVGSAEILSFCVSGMGVQAMQSIPIIIGGSVLFGTILGYTVLKEILTATGWVGVLFIAIGIGLVGIDPGGAGSVH